MRGLGQSGETETEGSGLPGGDVLPDETSVIPAPIDYTQEVGITYVRDASNALWTCQDGKCCDASNNCMMGAPTNAAPIYTSAAAKVNADDVMRSSQTAANLAKLLNVSTTTLNSLLRSGAVAPAGVLNKSCPTGYVYTANGRCAGSAASASIVPGLDNKTLVLIGIGLLGLAFLKGAR